MFREVVPAYFCILFISVGRMNKDQLKALMRNLVKLK